MSLQEDPVNKAIQKAIYQGIKRGIEIMLKNECWGSAFILIYSGIDAMASLGMPIGQIEVTGKDFKDWITRYLKDSSEHSYPEEDMWGARCAVLHQFGAESKLSRSKKIRLITYVNGGPEIQIRDTGTEHESVWLNFYALEKNFSRAIDNFLMKKMADESFRPTLEKRLHDLLQPFSLLEKPSTTTAAQSTRG